MSSSLVSVTWLSKHYQDSDVITLYTRSCTPGTDTLPTQPSQFIPGSQLFDFESTFCDSQSDLPHTLPSQQEFELQLRKLGVNQRSKVVVYDQAGIFTSPRVWWMLRVFGFSNVYVLDGGLPAWLQAGLPTQQGLSSRSFEGNVVTKFCSQLIYDLEQVKNRDERTQVLDARSAARFSGKQADPRKGVRAGHIPGSINLPFDQVLNNGFLKPVAELTDLFPQDSPLVFSCGSGVTACILALAANECGLLNWAVYDGSWAQWGSSNEPIISVEE